VAEGSVQGPIVKRPYRRLVTFLLVLGGIIGGPILLMNSRFAWEQSCALARRELPSLLGMKVEIGRCELDPLAKTLRLYDVAASPLAKETGPSFAAEAVEVRISSLRPLFGKAELDLLRVTHPRIDVGVEQFEAAPATPVSACPFNALSKVHVREFQVLGGGLNVALPGSRRVEVDDIGMSWLEERGTAQFEIRVGGGAVKLAPSGELPITKGQLSGVLFIDESRLDVGRAQLELGQIGISLSGTVDQLCDPKLTLDSKFSLPLESLSQAGLLQGSAGGQLAIRVSIRGAPYAPTISTRIVGTQVAVRQYQPGDFEARLSYRPGEISLDELLLGAGAGTVKVNGAVKLQKDLPARFKAEIEGAEFARVLEKAGLKGSWVNFFATGRVNVSGRLLPALQLVGEADISARAFSLATRPFDSPLRAGATVLSFEQGHVAMAVRFLSDRVEMQRARIDSGKSQVTADATLFYAPTRGLSISGRADPLDLSDFRRIAHLEAGGVGSAQFEISGPYGDVGIESSASFHDLDFSYFALGRVQGKIRYRRKLLTFAELSGQKGKTPYSASGELNFDRELYSTWDIRVPRGHTEDILDAIAGLHPAFELFQGVSSGEASGVIHLASPASKLAGKVELTLTDTLYYGRRLGDGKVTLRFVNGEAIVVDEARLRGPFAQMSAAGTYSFDGPLKLRFRADHLSVAELVGVERSRVMALSGEATMVGTVGGDSTTPEVTAYLHSPQVNLGESATSELRLEGRIVGRQLEIWGRPLQGTRFSAKATLQEPYPFQASLAVALKEVRPLLPPGMVGQGLSGSIDGSVDARGNLADRRSLDLNGRINRLRLARADFTGENVGPVSLSYRAGRWELQTVTFRGPNTELTMGGWLGPTELDAQLNGSIDVRLLESFTPALERSSGRVEISAAATGSLSDPSILGRAEIGDVRVSLRDYPVTLVGLNGRVEFSEARLLVQDLGGVLNEGRVMLRGSLAFQHLGLKSIELALHLDEVAFRPWEYLPVTVSGELNLLGKREAMVLSGDLDVIKLRYDQPLAVESLLTQFKTKQSLPGADRTSERLALDVGIHAKGDITVENNLARAKLAGDVRLTGTNASPGLVGNIQALSGSQAFFRGNQFTISQGTLEFKERKSIDPVFDLQAETQVREYLVRLHAFGRASDPKLVLSAEPALSEGDILSLLTLGITSRDKSNTAQASAGIAAEAFFSASGLDRQVQRFVPKNPVLRDFGVHVATAYNERSGVVEPNWQFEAKFLTEQLKLQFTEPFSGRGRKAQAEYFFDNRVSAQAQWDNDNSAVYAPVGNFGLNLRLHWETD